MVFAQKFEFSSQNLSISLLKNLIFQPSEARLSSITQNWNKSLSFHNFIPKGLTNFECPNWKLYTLNYHTVRTSVHPHFEQSTSVTNNITLGSPPNPLERPPGLTLTLGKVYRRHFLVNVQLGDIISWALGRFRCKIAFLKKSVAEGKSAVTALNCWLQLTTDL